MKIITSTQNEYIKKLKILDNKKNIQKAGIFLVEGKNIISIAKQKNLLINVLSSDENIEFNNFVLVDEKIIKALSSYKTPQGVIGVCKYESKTTKQYKKIIVLDDVNIPNNVGSIIRSAAAFGFDAVIVSNQSAFPWMLKSIQASQGGIFEIDIVQTNIVQYLQEYNYDIIATTLIDSNNIEKLKLDNNKNIAIVVGSEAKGIRSEIIEMAHHNVKIPIQKMESLNVSIASGIIMFYVSNLLK